MTTLAEFLLARYDEDEASTLSGECRCEDNGATRPDCGSRIIDDAAAKRRIVALHPTTENVINPGYGPHVAAFGCETCHDWDGITEGRGDCDTLRALAAPYSDHPDFDPSWRIGDPT
jgi:hypothetical protein